MTWIDNHINMVVLEMILKGQMSNLKELLELEEIIMSNDNEVKINLMI